MMFVLFKMDKYKASLNIKEFMQCINLIKAIFLGIIIYLSKKYLKYTYSIFYIFNQ